ncbi:hypothetical protein CPB85DRAFT_244854 [Mucidula mucida]|nr:hypothetical protein CPB85DRAFT_244854 [Mucidula mucida]
MWRILFLTLLRHTRGSIKSHRQVYLSREPRPVLKSTVSRASQLGEHHGAPCQLRKGDFCSRGSLERIEFKVSQIPSLSRKATDGHHGKDGHDRRVE